MAKILIIHVKCVIINRNNIKICNFICLLVQLRLEVTKSTPIFFAWYLKCRSITNHFVKFRKRVRDASIYTFTNRMIVRDIFYYKLSLIINDLYLIDILYRISEIP